ncbi:MAG: DUF432 domain-containing protein [Armatimonadetes bacterium]|nr:DUF432 domain-containing protein [Armatimonadota bacterium]
MFGEFNIPINIDKDSLNISIKKNDKGFDYIRELPNDKIEKLILTENAKILINPVEPLNTPKELTSLLLIEFNKSISIQPGIRKTIFITFPIEIGIFLSKKKDFELFDVFSLSKQKFTLYGDPGVGVVCKYWKSDVFLTLPDINPLYEGFIELKIYNPGTSWINVHKALFKAEGMKIFFDDQNVCMKAKMKVTDDDTAETEFIDSPYEKDMKKAVDIFNAKKLSVSTSKTIMLEGI